MNAHKNAEARGFATDEALGYSRSRKRFQPGERLIFDEPYRYAHLPLINPQHPLAVHRPEGLDYLNGRYDDERLSVVIPVRDNILRSSAVFQRIDRAMRQASFANKIAFDLCDKRRALQHITLSSGIKANDCAEVAETLREKVAHGIPLQCQLRAPFIGSKNFGRIYFPAYPIQHFGQEAYGEIQSSIGFTRTGFYAMGYYNFIEELSPLETADLQSVLDQFEKEIILEMVPDELWILATHDDLVLASRVVSRIEIANSSE